MAEDNKEPIQKIDPKELERIANKIKTPRLEAQRKEFEKTNRELDKPVRTHSTESSPEESK